MGCIHFVIRTFMAPRILRSLLVFALLASSAPALPGEDGANSSITVYPAPFFAAAQPSSSFDMLAVLPGYVFSESNSDVRGFSGAFGNVLIDGSRPTNKQESLESVLRRIPATTVERIELIRAGAPGIDMQGQTVLANVVRRREAQTRGSVEAESGFYERGFRAPRLAGEFSRRSARDLIEFSAAAYEVVDDEHGIGTRPRVSPDGTVLKQSKYIQDEGEKTRELAGLYERAVASGLLRVSASLKSERSGADISEHVSFPENSMSTVREFGDEDGAEFGVNWEQHLAGDRRLELLATHRVSGEHGGEIENETDAVTRFTQDVDASESIVRGALRWNVGQVSIESGIEGALNMLQSYSALEEDGIDMPVPNGATRVEEHRGELFAIASWPLGQAWQMEAGSRFEYSRIDLSGDSILSKSFFFVKPRALATWTISGNDRLRLLLEREVGQLDFEDFAGSASLSSSTVTAGNPDLEPERTWRVEAAWERGFWGSGVLVLAARHERIDELIDRIPIIADEPFDAVGNIGDGRRTEVEFNLTLPLDRIGIPSGLLRTRALWRDGSTTDPTTKESRQISEDLPREVDVQFSQKLPRARLRWGVELNLASAAREHYFDEVRVEKLGTRLDVFAQYEPTTHWNVRVFANNLTDRSAVRERQIHEGVRGVAPLSYLETRTLRIGPWVGINLRRTFGD
jgi:outer membrane receptor protein involved in Fe transport